MGKTILIAEDEPSLLNMLVRRVKSLGYEVISAADGVEALKQVQLHKPDLILLDIIMPKKNGLDVLQDLRVTMGVKTPVIVLSNLDKNEDIEAARSYGVEGYMIKSNISIRELSKLIADALG